jgi:hypothetical protein
VVADDTHRVGTSLGKVIGVCTTVLILSVSASSAMLYMHADGERTARNMMQEAIQKRLDDGFIQAREDIREIRADVKALLQRSK